MRHWLIALGVITLLTGIFHNLADIIPDVDSLYHVRHAWLYRTEGLLDSSFPWTQFSVINTIGSDIWYGFHILIIPFTLFGNLLDGIAWGGMFVTIAVLALVYAALHRLAVRWPLAWLLLFFFASPDALYRLTMLRPHPLSLGLALVIFTLLLTREDEQKKRTILLLALAGAAFSWIHISLAWLPVGIAIVITGARLVQRMAPEWAKIGALFGGLAVGILARPNPFGAVKLAYIQVFQLLVDKQGGLPIRFGRELTPFVWENFVDQLIPITLFAIAGLTAAIWLWRKDALQSILTGTISGAILMIGFFGLTFAVARRSNELFVAFAVLFLALVTTRTVEYMKERRKTMFEGGMLFIGLALLAALVSMPIKTIYRHITYLQNAFVPTHFQDVGEWLKENAEPEAIVFNPHWDRFAQLFYWNHHNYYINGMDPIFLFANNPSLYWKTHFYAINQAGPFTCAMVRCQSGETVPTYEVLKDDFRASYVVVERRRSTLLAEYLEHDNRFEKVFDNAAEVIFKIH